MCCIPCVHAYEWGHFRFRIHSFFWLITMKHWRCYSPSGTRLSFRWLLGSPLTFLEPFISSRSGTIFSHQIERKNWRKIFTIFYGFTEMKRTHVQYVLLFLLQSKKIGNDFFYKVSFPSKVRLWVLNFLIYALIP